MVTKNQMNEFEISVKRFDEFAAEYTKRFMDVSAYHAHFRKFCDSISTKRPVILELGCGPGNVTQYLLQQLPQAKITAIDLAPAMIEIAQKHLPEVNFRLMDVRDISGLNEKFDAIMCSFCLPFLSKTDTSKLIADCSVLLNASGVLFLSTMEGDETHAGFENTSFSGNAQVYFNYHKYEELEKALHENSFTIDHCQRQDYLEPNGSTTTDLILIGRK